MGRGFTSYIGRVDGYSIDKFHKEHDRSFTSLNIIPYPIIKSV